MPRRRQSGRDFDVSTCHVLIAFAPPMPLLGRSPTSLHHVARLNIVPTVESSASYL